MATEWKESIFIWDYVMLLIQRTAQLCNIFSLFEQSPQHVQTILALISTGNFESTDLPAAQSELCKLPTCSKLNSFQFCEDAILITSIVACVSRSISIVELHGFVHKLPSKDFTCINFVDERYMNLIKLVVRPASVITLKWTYLWN